MIHHAGKLWPKGRRLLIANHALPRLTAAAYITGDSSSLGPLFNPGSVVDLNPLLHVPPALVEPTVPFTLRTVF